MKQSLKTFLCFGLATLLVLSGVMSQAQIKLGVKGGLCTYDLGVNEAIMFTYDTDQFALNVQDARYGYHAGIVIQARIASFVIQPEILFNSNSVDYTFKEVTQSTPSNVFTEKYQNLDFPLMVGLKAGPLRLMAGPVGHYFLSSTTELDFGDYKQVFDEFTFGWQAGIGLDLLNLMLDVRYEGNFYTFGDHIVFANQSYAFDNSPARLVASLGITIK